MATLSAYNFDEFLRNVPAVLVSHPVAYQAGSDNAGRPVVVIDWNRVDLRRSAIQEVVKAVALTFKAVLQQAKSTQVLVLNFAQHVKVRAAEKGSARRLVRAVACALVGCFPDADAAVYYFVPSRLRQLAEFGRSWVPQSSAYRHLVAEEAVLRAELALRCANVKEVLPQALGGNEVSLERNVCWMVTQEDEVVAKVLDREDSNARNIVIVNEDRRESIRAPPRTVPELVTLGA